MYIMAGLILVIGLTSCEKEKTKPNGDIVGKDGVVKAQTVVITDRVGSFPTTVASDGPYLIPGKNKGGNRTCEEVLKEFPEYFKIGDFTECGEKVDIDDDYWGAVKEFPFEVKILENGTISFDIGERNCLVYAVIVKGSNQANVYIYPDGVTMDEGLLPPPFNPEADVLRYPWVSNITFCCDCSGGNPPKTTRRTARVPPCSTSRATDAWRLSTPTRCSRASTTAKPAR